MHPKYRFLFLSLAGLLTLLLLSQATKPVSGSGLTKLNSYAPLPDYLLSDSDQTSDCISILLEAAQQGGVEGILTGTDEYPTDDDGGQICVADFRVYTADGLEVRRTGLDLGMQPYYVDCNLEDVDGYTTFHGYDAQIETYRHITSFGDTQESKSIYWLMERGGRCHFLSVRTVTLSIEEYGVEADPFPIANALWSIAEDRLPLAELPVDDAEEPFLPVDPAEVVPGQPEMPTDPTLSTDPADTDGLFDIPLPIILGSLGIPVAGALAGAALSTILSGFSSAAASSAPVSNAVASTHPATTAKPKIGSVNPDGLYWSERPWDEAGPGFVPKEEYERTKDLLEKGYKWEHGGWRTPDQIRQNDQWEQNDREAVARTDAEWRAKRESERQGLEQNKAELKKKADDLQAAEDKFNILEMEDDFETIQQGLEDENIYVLNPYQGDPTLLFHGINKAKNMVWDNTIGRWTGDQGLTCEGYVEKTKEKVVASVAKRFPGAKVQNMLFMEKSSLKPTKNLTNFLDSINDDNHNLIKVILPDGSEWALDFHQYNAGKSPLLRPWSEARKVWKDYLGEKEFIESIRHTYTTSPKPDL